MSSSASRAPCFRTHFLPILGLAALFGWMFARFIVHGWYLADSDLYDYFLPLFLSPIRRWSSYEFSGLPAFADPGDFTYYPPNLILGEWAHSWTLVVMSAYVLAAWFTYAYVYSVTRSRIAALFAALAYSMSEAMLERMAHLGSIHAAAWVPLIALAADRVRGAHRERWIAIGGLAVASCVLSGHPQPAIYAMYALGAYALIGLLVERATWRHYAATAAMFLVGAMLAAVKLLPLAEASEYIARQEVNFERFVGRVLTGPQTLSVLFPTVIHNDPREAPTYVGVATVLLAFVALARIRRDWRVAFWGVVCSVTLLLALGTATPLVDFAYSVPLYNRFRNISRHLFLFAFGMSVLAGFAVAALQRQEVSRLAIRGANAVLLLLVVIGGGLIAWQPGWFEFETIWGRPGPGPLSILAIGIWIQVGIAIAAAALIFWMSRTGVRPASGALLIALLVADLLSALPHNVLADGVEFTSVDESAVRPSVHAQALARELQNSGGRLLAIEGANLDPVVPAAFARVWKIPIAGGYGPMLLHRYSEFASIGTNGEVRPAVLDERDAALDMLAVRYILVNADESGQALRQALSVNPRWRDTRHLRTSRSTDRGGDIDGEGEEDVAVFENRRALPRVRIVSSTAPVDDRAALTAIHESTLPDGSTFDPRTLALVASEGPQPPRSFPAGRASARIVATDDGVITVAASTTANAFLVLAENYYPAWRAWIDDRETPVYRTDLTLQGIVVPAGTHRIEFRLVSRTLQTGALISGAGLVLCLALLLAFNRQRAVVT
jgi:hypothetical protein